MTAMVDQTSTPTARNPGSGVYSNDVTFGQRFTVSAGVTIQSVSWCRMTAGDARPTHVVVWNETDNVLVGAHAFSMTDDGTTGWHAEDAGPWSLVTGKTYSVGRADPAGGVACGWLTSPPVPPSPFTVTGCYANNQGGSAPASLSVSVGSWELLAVSIDTDPAGGGGGGGGGGLSDTDLANWLSIADNTKGEDSAPIHLNTLATGASGFAAIKGVVDTIAASVGAGLHTALTAIGADVTSINTALTAHISTWSSDLATTIQSWNDGLVDWFNKMGGLAGGPVGAISGRTAFPTELWTLVNEADHTGPFVYEQAADLYVLTVTDADGQTPTAVAGVQWYPRIGWWCPFNGTQGTQRRFWDLAENQLDDQGRRMPGALVWTRPLVQTHIQAWQLT